MMKALFQWSSIFLQWVVGPCKRGRLKVNTIIVVVYFRGNGMQRQMSGCFNMLGVLVQQKMMVLLCLKSARGVSKSNLTSFSPESLLEDEIIGERHIQWEIWVVLITVANPTVLLTQPSSWNHKMLVQCEYVLEGQETESLKEGTSIQVGKNSTQLLYASLRCWSFFPQCLSKSDEYHHTLLSNISSSCRP